MEHSFDHTHFCIYNYNSLVNTVYVKVVRERQSKHNVEAFFLYCQELTFPLYSFGKCIIKNFSSFTYVRYRGAESSPQNSHNFNKGG